MRRLTGWLALLGLLVGSARAQERSLTIQQFSAAIAVKPDGSIEVAETLTARFVGTWNGLFRTIPVEYRTPTVTSARR